MKQAKSVDEQLNEIFDYSVRLESRRGEITEFEVARLKGMLPGARSNSLLRAVSDLLVSELERDFIKFDAALEAFINSWPGFDLRCSVASTAQFAFNPAGASTLLHQCLQSAPDDLDLHHSFTHIAWFSGDLELCSRMVELRTHLEDKPMAVDSQVVKAMEVLDVADVKPALYQELMHSVHECIREATSFERDIKVSLDLDVDKHEDGSSGILLQIFSDMNDEKLDRLDDSIDELMSDTDRWGTALPRVMTVLVRDIVPEAQADGGCFA